MGNVNGAKINALLTNTILGVNKKRMARICKTNPKKPGSCGNLWTFRILFRAKTMDKVVPPTNRVKMISYPKITEFSEFSKNVFIIGYSMLKNMNAIMLTA